MFVFGKRAASFIVAGTLALGGLAGCGAQQQGGSQAAAPAAPEYASAMEVYEAYEKNPNHDNFHTDLKYDIALDFLGQALEIDADSQIDVAGDAAHGITKMSSEALGQNAESEVYVAKGEDGKYTQYASSEDSGTKTWTKQTTDVGNMANQLVEKELFNDAKFEKTDSGYKVTVSGKSFSKAIAGMGLDNYASMMGDDNALTEALEKSEGVYLFDKEGLLTEMNYTLDLGSGSDAASSSSSSTAEGEPELSASMKMNIKMTCSDYGKIDAAKVAVPEDVKSSAVDGGEVSLSDLTSGTATTTTTEEVAVDAAAEGSASESSSSAA